MRITSLLLPSAVSLLIGLAATAASAADTTQPSLPASDKTATQTLASSPRHGEFIEIPLEGSDAKLKCFVVYPERKDKAPVVVVIHEIFGLSDWARAVDDQLAAEGFIAISPDYLSGKGPNGGGTESFAAGDVGRAIQQLKPQEIEQRTSAARTWALAQPSATDKSATIGFCWGGGQSFAYATKQPALNAAVVYYGTPPQDKEQLKKINCPVLGCYGGMDNRVTSTVEPTTAAMKDAGKTYEPHVYEGAGHSFLRQQSGQNGANQKAAEGAWMETINFLKANLEAH